MCFVMYTWTIKQFEGTWWCRGELLFFCVQSLVFETSQIQCRCSHIPFPVSSVEMGEHFDWDYKEACITYCKSYWVAGPISWMSFYAEFCCQLQLSLPFRFCHCRNDLPLLLKWEESHMVNRPYLQALATAISFMWLVCEVHIIFVCVNRYICKGPTWSVWLCSETDLSS